MARLINIITKSKESNMRMLKFNILKSRRKSRKNTTRNSKSIWNIRRDLRNNIESILSNSKSSMRSIRGSFQCKLILCNQSMFRIHNQFQLTTKSKTEYILKKFPPTMKKSVITPFLTPRTQPLAQWSLIRQLATSNTPHLL